MVKKTKNVDSNVDSNVILKEDKPKKPNKTKKNNNVNTQETDNQNIVDQEQIDVPTISCIEDNIDNEEGELVAENQGKIIASKKRGRKPKGGKIVQQLVPLLNHKETKPNIILHLKCSLKDIHNDIFINNHSIESFHFSSGKNDLNYEIIGSNNEFMEKHFITNELENDFSNNEYTNCLKEEEDCNDKDSFTNHAFETKQIWKKLKQLEYNLHINNISDKKSACFWCTYDFDNPPVYIPKHYIKDSYDVYGCFCSPECATAFLMEENIDSSAKFERYQLLNHIYSKIYEYKKNIKPSPNPYYMLEKYYGNLSIQEYRSLLRNERLFLIVDKPLTRILPELHEDNDDFIINNKIIPSNNVPIKGKLRKKIQSKSNILTEKFGLTQ